MTATVYDFTIEQGADCDFTVAIQNSDGSQKALSGSWTGSMQARETVDDVDTLFSVTPTVDTVNSIVTVHIPASQTATYDWTAGVYDLEITNGSSVIRVLQGTVTLSPQVTR